MLTQADQLALDLLRQPADRDRHRDRRRCASLDDEPGIGLGAGTDVLGALTVTAALMLGVYTIVGPAATDGWTRRRTLGFGAGRAGPARGCSCVRETTAANPLVPLRDLPVPQRRRRQPDPGAAASPACSASSSSARCTCSRCSATARSQIGLAFLPTTLLMGALSVRYTEPLATRFGARRVLIAGLVLIGAGLVVFAQAPVDASYLVHVLPVMVLLGVAPGWPSRR